MARGRWIPHKPHPKQALFLVTPARDIFFGGAGGGGKSDAELMAALQFVDFPGYAALIIRRSFTESKRSGALLARMYDWLAGSGAEAKESGKFWMFPGGGRVDFGYVASDGDLAQYKGSNYDAVIIDEASQFPEHHLKFFFERLRRLKGSKIPSRFRLASNPGGLGHEWIKLRYISSGAAQIIEAADDPPVLDYERRVFIPSKLADNPAVDAEDYRISLSNLDPIQQERILNGDWDVVEGADFFPMSLVVTVKRSDLPLMLARARFFDLAATDPKKTKGRKADWTASAKMGRDRRDNRFLLHIARTQKDPLGVEDFIRSCIAGDEPQVCYGMEQEGGASGKIAIEHFAQDLFRGYAFEGIPPTGSKVIRAKPLVSHMRRGKFFIVEGEGVEDLLSEMRVFPMGSHDDQIDAMSGADEVLNRVPVAAVPEEVRRSTVERRAERYSESQRGAADRLLERHGRF